MGVRSRLLDVLGAALRQVSAWRDDEHLVVAVSGGPDSTALLAGLVRLAPQLGYRLTAAHVAHGLRGPESELDVEAVRTLAESLEVPWVVETAHVPGAANLEARARTQRYRALGTIARQVGGTRILTGHTQDDQVETVLLRLLRGAGRRGLGGIAPQRGRLLRPLLGATRDDVRRFLAESHLSARLDRSNADLRFRRNRVRRLLVPILQQEFNPRLGDTLATLATHWRDEDAYLAATAQAAAAEWLDGVRLSQGVARAPTAIGRRVVFRWLAQHSGPPSAAHVAAVFALAGRGVRGQVVVRGGRVVASDGQWLTVGSPGGGTS